MKKVYTFILMLMAAMFGQSVMAQEGHEVGKLLTIEEVNAADVEVVIKTRTSSRNAFNNFAEKTYQTAYDAVHRTHDYYLESAGEEGFYIKVLNLNVKTDMYLYDNGGAYDYVEDKADATLFKFEGSTSGVGDLDPELTGEELDCGARLVDQSNQLHLNVNGGVYNGGTGCWTIYFIYKVEAADAKTYTCHVVGHEDGRVCYDSYEYEDGEQFEAVLDESLLSALPIDGYRGTITVDSCDITATYELLGSYPINFSKDQCYNRSDRHTIGISLTEGDNDPQELEVPFTTYNETRCYQFLTEDDPEKKFYITAGSAITPGFSYVGAWMKGYVYVDEDNDDSFEGDMKTPSGADGPRVDGGTFTEFDAPAVPGEYRMRFIVDWNNEDPGGNLSPADGTVFGSNGIIANGGSITDVILVVEEATAEHTIIYNYIYKGEIVGNESFTVREGKPFPTPKLAPAYASYTLPEGVVTKDEEFDIEITFENYPFELAESAESAQWYYIKMRGDMYAYYDAEPLEEGQYTPCSDVNLKTDEFLWAFVGDPVNGFNIYNKAAGTEVALTYDPTCDTYNYFTAEPTMYVTVEAPAHDDRNVYIRVREAENFYFNYRSGMYYWDNAAAKGEVGSALAIESVRPAREDLHDLIEVAEAKNYGENAGKVGWLTTEAAEAFLGAIEAAKEVYNDSTLTETDYREAEAALRELINGFGADALQFPEVGMTVVFRNCNYDLSTNYTLYMDVEGLKIANNEDMGEAQQFELEAGDEEGTLAAKNVATGSYMIWKSGNGAGYNDNTGMLDEYESPYCDWSFPSCYNILKGTFVLLSVRADGASAGSIIIKEDSGEFNAWGNTSSGTRTDYCNMFFIEEVSGEDGIVETIGNKNQTAGGIYNLAGQAVGKDYKGIVISDGKKTLVK